MDETWSAKVRSILADVTASTRRLAAAHSIIPSSSRFLPANVVRPACFVRLSCRIRPQFDEAVSHQRAKGVRQRRDADSQPLGQCLERWTIIAAKAVDLGEQPELSGLEVRRGNRLVVAKQAGVGAARLRAVFVQGEKPRSACR